MFVRSLDLWFSGLILALPAFCAAAPLVNNAPRPQIEVPQAHSIPAMTALPSDPAWVRTPQISALMPSLQEQLPAAAPERTTVSLQWTPDTLYVRFVCMASGVSSPYTERDDPLYKADVVELFLDAKGDSRQWIEIEVSPSGVIFDQNTTLTADPVSDASLILDSAILQRDDWPDLAWNMEGLSATSRILRRGKAVTGWITDIALPAAATLHRLGLTAFRPMPMRANFLRYERPLDAAHAPVFVPSDWAPVLTGCPHISPQAMGTLTLVNH